MLANQADIDQNPPEAGRRGILSRGLARTLLVSFLVLALSPMVVVSVISYRNAHRSLHDHAEMALLSVARLKTDQIDAYFQEILEDLELQAEMHATVQFMEALSRAYRESGQRVGEFTKSFKWATIVDERGGDLKIYRRAHEYQDILLVDSRGNVLFTVAEEEDLGTNLHSGACSGALFATACKKCLDTGRSTFSDYEAYGPSGGSVCAFMASVIVDEAGDKIGVIAMQFHLEGIDRIMQAPIGLGRTAEAYLVGPDLRMRSNSVLSDEDTVLKEPVATEQTRLWQQQIDEGIPVEEMEHLAFTYNGPRGRPVLGVHHDITIGDTPFGVVAEIEAAEAFAPATTLRNQLIAILLVSSVFIVVVALVLTRGLVRPVLALTRGAEAVRGGDLSHRITVTSRNEVGVLASTFNEMLDRLQQQTRSLRQVSYELETIIDSIPGLVFYKDAENRYVRVNEFVANSHKMKKDELEGASCFDLYPREQAQAYFDDDLQVIQSRTPKLNIDEPWETAAGVRWVSTSKIPYLDQEGQVAGVIGVSMDITERKEAEQELEQQAALKTAQAGLSDVMRGDLSMEALCRNIITFLCNHFGVQTGLMYVADDQGTMRPTASYAHKRKPDLPCEYGPGEGLVGQVALEQRTIVLSDVPPDYLTIESGLGETVPRSIVLAPIAHNDEVRAVIELGALEPLGESQTEFLDSANENIGIAIQAAQGREGLAKALERSQRLTEELQAQQEELEASNEELEEQTQLLKASEGRLQAQQEELRTANEELEETNETLERQKRNTEQANQELDRTRREIEQKAEELAIASKYKSEFLANMSHELRTPLNSLLILARSLRDNRDGNLTGEQVESADVIYSSGNDLLALINEILDLSKIEAGRLELETEDVSVQSLAEGVEATFRHVAEEKGLSLEVRVAESAPASIVTDSTRVEQVIRNLMSNAIKFTTEGGITVTFAEPGESVSLARNGLDTTDAVAISVADTGIGIPADKQKIIFEAFQQAEGGAARTYGGTGLGLSISRELASLLGGEIQLESEPGQGTTFTVYLPVQGPEARGQKPDVSSPASDPDLQSSIFNLQSSPPALPDDREGLDDGDRTVLIIEDDEKFAKILMDRCRGKGLKCLAAVTGEEGLRLAEEHLPNGIVLDIRLPGIDGWAVLDALKENPTTRHIPVHIMSVEEATMDALRKGAIGYLTKPATPEELQAALGRLEEELIKDMKELLVIEDDATLRQSIIDLIGNGDVHAEAVGTGQEALDRLTAKKFDCMILDLGLPDMTGFELLKRLEATEALVLPPVIVYTGRELTRDENAELSAYSDSIIIKGVRSEERLLDEASLFLHRVVADLPESKRQIITDLHDTDAMLRGKRVLIVDDDMRNVFALSRELTARGIKTSKAENGQKALDLLPEEPDIDLVLMDIMMPAMDGYEAIRQIRNPQSAVPNHDVPIIALTAKAMKDDRERCLAAGASDYLSKPVDLNRLFSMMRVWLYR